MQLKYFLSKKGFIPLFLGFLGIVGFFIGLSVLRDGSVSYPATILTILFLFLVFEWFYSSLNKENKLNLIERLKYGIVFVLVLAVLSTIFLILIAAINAMINTKSDWFTYSGSILISLFMGAFFLLIIPMLFSSLTFNINQRFNKKLIVITAILFVVLFGSIFLIETIYQANIADYWSYGFPLAYYIAYGPCYNGLCVGEYPLNLVIDIVFLVIVSFGLARVFQRIKLK